LETQENRFIVHNDRALHALALASHLPLELHFRLHFSCFGLCFLLQAPHEQKWPNSAIAKWKTVTCFSSKALLDRDGNIGPRISAAADRAAGGGEAASGIWPLQSRFSDGRGRRAGLSGAYAAARACSTCGEISTKET